MHRIGLLTVHTSMPVRTVYDGIGSSFPITIIAATPAISPALLGPLYGLGADEDVRPHGAKSLTGAGFVVKITLVSGGVSAAF